MNGRVTVFPSGKMISVGAKSVNESIQQLNNAKFYLTRDNFISDIKLQIKIQNIVATLTLGRLLPIHKLATKLDKAIYEPEQFPAIILKYAKSVSYLIFSSGKIVIIGAKSLDEISHAAYDIQQKILSL